MDDAVGIAIDSPRSLGFCPFPHLPPPPPPQKKNWNGSKEERLRDEPKQRLRGRLSLTPFAEPSKQ